MSTEVYRFSKDFGRCPGARLREEGPLSGEEFFETVLKPRHERRQKTIIDLTGAMGFATAFLDGAFGEFAERFGKGAFYDTFEVKVDDDPTLPQEIEKALGRGEEARKGRP